MLTVLAASPSIEQRVISRFTMDMRYSARKEAQSVLLDLGLHCRTVPYRSAETLGGSGGSRAAAGLVPYSAVRPSLLERVVPRTRSGLTVARLPSTETL